jgi:MFS family permease
VSDASPEAIAAGKGANGANGADGANGSDEPSGALDVFRNRPFLLLWLSQLFTQIGGNMVLYGLTVIVVEVTGSKTANSLLILTFLVPAVLFSAVAGVYVDRFDKRVVLVATNVLRTILLALLWLAGANVLILMLLNMLVSTVTVFFAPAEAAMIPQVVPRRQLLAANGVFTLTLNAAFALGFALLGPIVVTLLGAPGLILVVAACYLIAAGFCWTLPPSPPPAAEEGAEHRSSTAEAEEAIGSTFGQLREGMAFIRATPRIAWSLVYLGIAASLVGVLGVLGPGFAKESLELETKDFVVVVLPLGFGIVMGILLLNSFGHLAPRRRIIEYGLVALGILLFMIAAAGPISRALQRAEAATGLVSLADFTSLLAIVVLIALLAGIAYAFVAIPAQTQLQEEIPEDVRGRVFGVLNMLVSTASFLPIIIVGPVADIVGTTIVLYFVAAGITFSGLVSILTRGPLKPSEARQTATGPMTPAGLDPVAVATASSEMDHGRPRRARGFPPPSTSGSVDAGSAAPVDAGSAAPVDVEVPASVDAGDGQDLGRAPDPADAPGPPDLAGPTEPAGPIDPIDPADPAANS